MTLEAVIPLGINGFFASFGRQTMSFLVLGSRSALLLDAGSGIGRLVEPGLRERLTEIDRLDVLLTHFHLDHVSGLPALPSVLEEIRTSNSVEARARLPMDVTVWAPAPPLIDAVPFDALERLLSPPLFPVGIGAFQDSVALREYSGSEHLEKLAICCETENIPVSVRRQSHPGGSVGVRLGDRLAYITDTRADPETVAFVADVDLLLHEVWVSRLQADSDPSTVVGHSDATSVREIVREGRVARLLPVHNHPFLDQNSLDQLHRELECSDFELVKATEGQPISLDGS